MKQDKDIYSTSEIYLGYMSSYLDVTSDYHSGEIKITVDSGDSGSIELTIEQVEELHNALGEFLNSCAVTINPIQEVTQPVAQEQPKTESQQLVGILVQLGFKEVDEYNPELYCDYNYISKKLDIYWLIGGEVYNDSDKGINDKIYGESIATNIAYFQKKLDKKLAKQASQV